MGELQKLLLKVVMTWFTLSIYCQIVSTQSINSRLSHWPSLSFLFDLSQHPYYPKLHIWDPLNRGQGIAFHDDGSNCRHPTGGQWIYVFKFILSCKWVLLDIVPKWRLWRDSGRMTFLILNTVLEEENAEKREATKPYKFAQSSRCPKEHLRVVIWFTYCEMCRCLEAPFPIQSFLWTIPFEI